MLRPSVSLAASVPLPVPPLRLLLDEHLLTHLPRHLRVRPVVPSLWPLPLLVAPLVFGRPFLRWLLWLLAASLGSGLLRWLWVPLLLLYHPPPWLVAAIRPLGVPPGKAHRAVAHGPPPLRRLLLEVAVHDLQAPTNAELAALVLRLPLPIDVRLPLGPLLAWAQLVAEFLSAAPPLAAWVLP